MYTSGWPKNQNKCWYSTGFPPPAGSKKEVFKFRSVKSIVIAPAKTGNLTISKTAVIATDHKNRGSRAIVTLAEVRDTRIVVKKLILPKIEETPARCKLKIAKSTEIPVWNLESERGG
jgi:hypothetical protein